MPTEWIHEFRAAAMEGRDGVDGRDRGTSARSRTFVRWRVGVGAPCWIVFAGTAIAALGFHPWSNDTFAWPKLMTLSMVVVVGLLLAVPIATDLRVVVAVDAPLVLFLILSVAATSRSVDPWTSIFGQFPEYQGLVATGVYFAGFLLARSLFSRALVDRWMIVVGATGAAVAAYALLQAAGLDPIWSSLAKGRTFSTIGQPNSLAAVLVVTSAITASLALNRRHVRWLIALAVQVAAVLTTLSRGGYLGLLVAGFVLLFATRSSRRVAGGRRLAVAALTVGTLAALAFVAVPPLRQQVGDAVTRVQSIVDSGNQSIRQRVALWEVALSATADQPLLGTGPDTFPSAFERYAPRVLDDDELRLFSAVRPESPHNVLLGIAAGSGIPAAACYAAMLGTVLGVAAIRYRRADLRLRVVIAGLAAAAGGHVVTDMFMTAEVVSSWLFWVTLGALMAVSINDDRSADGVVTARPVARQGPTSPDARADRDKRSGAVA